MLLSFAWLDIAQALALLLEDGAEGVDQDPEAALRWHLAAAEKGNAVQLASNNSFVFLGWVHHTAWLRKIKQKCPRNFGQS